MGIRRFLGLNEGEDAPGSADLANAYGERQPEMSRRLGDLVDVVYALVLIEGAREYHRVFTRPDEFTHLGTWLPVVIALLLIYFTAIQSFVDFHLAAEDQPFQLLRRRGRAVDLLRFYIDVVAVGLYSFLLLKCHVLIDDPGANIFWAFLAIPFVFVLYLVWGVLRRQTARLPGGGFSWDLLVAACLSYVVLALVYWFLPKTWEANAACLGAALALMALYRYYNWAQNPANGNPAAA